MARVSVETVQTARRLQLFASLLFVLVAISLATLALAKANQLHQAPRYSANTNKLNGYPSSYPATPVGAPANQRAGAGRRAQPAPAEEQPEESASVKGEVGADESMAMDPEFAALTSDMDSANSDVKDDVDMDNEEPVERAPKRRAGNQAAAASRPNNRASLVGTLESVRGVSEDESDDYSADEPSGLASALEGTQMLSDEGEGDLLMAAAHHHHHHHGHYAHGWLEMGAHTGKKGAFGWHDKHPVGSKGR